MAISTNVSEKREALFKKYPELRKVLGNSFRLLILDVFIWKKKKQKGWELIPRKGLSLQELQRIFSPLPAELIIYHLRKLEKAGLINLKSKYALTEKAEEIIDALSLWKDTRGITKDAWDEYINEKGKKVDARQRKDVMETFRKF